MLLFLDATHSTTCPLEIISQWVGLSRAEGTLEWMMRRVLYSYANPSLIASCERPKIHVSHCNVPQGHTVWQIKSGSLTLAGLTDVSLIFFADAQSKEWDWWGSCAMSCAHSISACLLWELLGVCLRDKRLQQKRLGWLKVASWYFTRNADLI